jgi:hypothetical protein
VSDSQYPPKERQGTTIEMLALDLAAARAAEATDHRLMRVASAAYALLGWGWWYLAEEISILSREEGRRFQQYAVSHKNRRLMRAEARGFVLCLQMLEQAGLLNERVLHEARNAVWIRSRETEAA